MSTDTLTLRLGDVEDLRSPGVGSLVVDHFCEVARDAGVRNIDPDWERYELLEDLERLIIWVVELDDEIVGYCSGVLAEHTHNRKQVQLVNDAIYVKPTVRRMGVGNLLMRAMEESAHECDADMMWHAPSHSRLDRILAGSKDYRTAYTAYIKKHNHDRS